MMKISYKFALSVLLLSNYAVNIEASTIKEVVEHTMANSPKIMSTMKNNEAYRLYIDEAKGGYLPTLDLTAFMGAKRTKTNPDIGANTDSRGRGFNAQLDFEQLIYDGGLTDGLIDEAQFRYNSNKYLNNSIVDDVVYNSVNSYLNLIKYEDRLAVTKKSLYIYSKYFTKARETEEISGEGLHKSQVNAKIHFANNKLYQDRNTHLSAVSSFTKSVGLKPVGKSCSPIIDESKIPNTLKGFIEEVLVKNPLILEQVEKIKEQKAVLNQKNANFSPTLKFIAQAIYDNGQETEDENLHVYSGRIEMSYNLFNGKRDQIATKREKLFLQEAQKTLDTVTKSVIDEATIAYNTFVYSKKREIELKKYIQDNKEILSFYKDQFEGGTRTFIDVLNIERDLLSAEENLVDISYDIDSSYFQMFNSLGMIKESVLYSNNESCSERKVGKEPYRATGKISPSKMIGDTVYGLYLAAYKNSNYAERTVEKVKSAIDADYKVKIENGGKYYSVLVYDIPSSEEAYLLKDQLSNKYSDAFIKKFKR